MNKTVKVIIGVVIVAALGVLGWMITSKFTSSIDYDQYDRNAVIGANADNGNIADHVKGNPDAKVVIVEYADYQCSGCAAVSGQVDKLVEKYGDKIAVVQRTYVLSYHQNGKAAAAASEAAALQGYWKEYGDLLFANQDDWFYSDANQRTAQFVEYFGKVAGDKADTDKFIADMSSENVLAKVKFDIALAHKMGDIPYTPAFFIDGYLVDWANNADENSTPYHVPTGDDGKATMDFVTYLSQIIDDKLK